MGWEGGTKGVEREKEGGWGQRGEERKTEIDTDVHSQPHTCIHIYIVHVYTHVTMLHTHTHTHTPLTISKHTVWFHANGSLLSTVQPTNQMLVLLTVVTGWGCGSGCGFTIIFSLLILTRRFCKGRSLVKERDEVHVHSISCTFVYDTGTISIDFITVYTYMYMYIISHCFIESDIRCRVNSISSCTCTLYILCGHVHMRV